MEPGVELQHPHTRIGARQQPVSPRPHPEVEVRVRGGAAATFTLSPERRAYTLRTPAPAGEELRLELRAPTWNRSDAFADQGVVVERVTVAPAR